MKHTKVRCAWLLFLLVLSPLQGREFSKRITGIITEAAGTILNNNHYRQQLIDNSISEIFFDNYMDALDLNHQIFLQSDIDEFREK